MQSLGKFGKFGGMYVAELLVPALEELEQAFLELCGSGASPGSNRQVQKGSRLQRVNQQSQAKRQRFQEEFKDLLANYAGRPTPLFYAKNLSRDYGGELQTENRRDQQKMQRISAEKKSWDESQPAVKIYLKREDLLHSGAHKINNTLGQGLLAKYMGKKFLMAETGAGQHGVATAIVGALLKMPTKVFMGAKDVQRQAPNVQRMKMLGAEVIAVESGAKTLKDAINEALRYWVAHSQDTFYVFGTVAGPHPYPSIVKYFQKVIGEEARRQILKHEGRQPDYVMACVGGGSNALGIFQGFLKDKKVRLIGVEPAGKGLASGKHGATLTKGTHGCLHGAVTYIMQDKDGQIKEAHSISAGLDYPGVGPEHAYLKDVGRAEYVAVTDQEAVQAFKDLTRLEGIIPALESSHALAYAKKLVRNLGRKRSGKRDAKNLQQSKRSPIIVVNLSGRGDKDLGNIITNDQSSIIN